MGTLKPSQKNLNKAANALEEGGVIICPTDTVYGFLADADNRRAIKKIYKIKKRPRSKPLPVFVRDLKMAKELAEISPGQEKILKKHWPGKFTFVLNRKDGRGTIALRISKYKFLNDLLKKINKPLAQTSVNISGKSAMAKINDILHEFGKMPEVSLIINAGNLPKRKPSAIIDLTNNKIKTLRP